MQEFFKKNMRRDKAPPFLPGTCWNRLLPVSADIFSLRDTLKTAFYGLEKTQYKLFFNCAASSASLDLMVTANTSEKGMSLNQLSPTRMACSGLSGSGL